MWRTRAVLSLLDEEIAGVPRDEAERSGERREAFARARRRALIVIALDWTAIAALVLLSDRTQPLLTLGPTEETVFTLGILAVAVHSGFRLGQLEKLRAVARAGARLAGRDPDL
jgi:hypothetical protein